MNIEQENALLKKTVINLIDLIGEFGEEIMKAYPGGLQTAPPQVIDVVMKTQVILASVLASVIEGQLKRE